MKWKKKGNTYNWRRLNTFYVSMKYEQRKELIYFNTWLNSITHNTSKNGTKILFVQPIPGLNFLMCILYWHWAWDSLLFRYYSEGFQAVEHFGNYITELTGKLSDIRQIQDDEKTDLIEVRNSLKNSPGLEKMVRLIWWK